MVKVRFGIIGMGVMGTNHSTWFEENRISNGVLKAVCDIDENKRSVARSKLSKDVTVYNNHSDLISNKEIDAVIIAAPHYFHPTIAIEALEAGLHVMIEKPAGVYTKAVRNMYEVAKGHPDSVFGIMLNERTNPVFQKAREMIKNGDIGNIRKATWITTDWWRPQNYYDSSSWRATWGGEGGGVLINQAPHQIDLMQWICGMPVKVTADLKYGSHRKINVEDDASIHLNYENGATGTFIICTHDVLGTNSFEILGDKGKIHITNSQKLTAKLLHESENDLNARMSFEEAKKIINGAKLEDLYELVEYDEHNKFGDQHCIILEDFCSAILSGTQLFAPATEGIHSLTVSNAMHLSSWLGKSVDIPFDEELFLNQLNSRIRDEGKYPEIV